MALEPSDPLFEPGKSFVCFFAHGVRLGFNTRGTFFIPSASNWGMMCCW
jgi:hypothetical protein